MLGSRAGAQQAERGRLCRAGAEADGPALPRPGRADVLRRQLPGPYFPLPLSHISTHSPNPKLLKVGRHRFQVASFYVLPPLDQHLATFGAFQASTAYYDDDSDPFGRSPSVMPYNRHSKAHVLHDPRNFIVGLSDEGGAGANVGFASKQAFSPVAAEVAQLDRYINSTLWGVHCPAAPPQYRSDCSLQDRATHGIKASLFWTNANGSWDAMSGMPGYKYQPEDFTGWKWDRPRAYSLFRAYNYPHQTVVYHSMCVKQPICSRPSTALACMPTARSCVD